MPFKLSKGDLARQPLLCKELVALRAEHKQVQAHVAYLGKGQLSDADQTAKARSEENMACLVLKIEDLILQINAAHRDVVVVGVADACDSHDQAMSLGEAAATCEARGRENVEAGRKAFEKARKLRERARLQHDDSGKVFPLVGDYILTAVAQESAQPPPVQGTVDELAVAIGLPVESAPVGPSRSSAETGEGDDVAGGAGEESALAPKAAAREAKVQKTPASGSSGGGAHRCPCGWSSDRQGSYTKHKKTCPRAEAEDSGKAPVEPELDEPAQKKAKN